MHAASSATSSPIGVVATGCSTRSLFFSVVVFPLYNYLTTYVSVKGKKDTIILMETAICK
jgi:hypothetical protein